MMSTRSILSAVNAVNLVNTVNAVQKLPPLGGVARVTGRIAIALIPSGDFGEITDNQLLLGRIELFKNHFVGVLARRSLDTYTPLLHAPEQPCSRYS
jgi:hypothetical protein